MSPKVTPKSEKKFQRKVLSINDKLEIIKMEWVLSTSALISKYNIGSSIKSNIWGNRLWKGNEK